ncbi:VCBS repeat-containing protein [Streptomyces sp. ISL-10]|uniref:FG-GAP repeat domain-containing protein n=1 Tax=Streptomyces sp. ISL-10 TaxID=2819172 RepID=UPI001BE8C862|nr:VCBS repeat-containing protein [Streptomyces sp. ISL-10]MBT2368878.1 VCBS repeat-containing protein [Streptomyces sp. ISL-10]
MTTAYRGYAYVPSGGDLAEGLVARDSVGNLWYYDRQFAYGKPYATRAKVGGGWQIYNQLTAGADLNGDGRPDLLARDTSGVLWLYKGTGSATAPYATRVKVGAGWQIYNQLSLTGDLTDDGKADAIARDTSGVLWLYKGTGSTTAPFTTRTKIGSGWSIYNSVL